MTVAGVLRRAGGEALEARDRLTHAAWGAGLSPDQFVERERRLRGHRFSAERMTSWFWVDAAGAVLSSCETFRVPSVCAGQAGTAYAVASVFTEPRLRGRGHAGRMMSALVQAVRAQDERAQALVLYSDVGAALYARAGFVPRPADDVVYTPLQGAPPDVRLLRETDLPEALGDARPSAGRFWLPPLAEQLDWHLERERIYCEVAGRPRGPCGAVAGSSTAVWTFDPRRDELMLLRVDARSPAEAEALIASARVTAGMLGAKTVRMWDVPRAFSFPGGVRTPRDGSLPMICPLAPDVDAESWLDVQRGGWV